MAALALAEYDVRPRYTASAPLATAAFNCGHPSAGDMSSGGSLGKTSEVDRVSVICS